MIRRVVPFKHWHLQWLKEKGVAEGGVFDLGTAAVAALELHRSWTAVADGEPIACGGTVEIWPGRHSGWAYLNKSAAAHMLFVTRAAEQVLQQVKGRIEMTVRCDFKAGHRWAKILGFVLETPVLKQFGPEGEDHSGYTRFS